MKMDLWLPSTFSRDFGNQRHDLVNCITGRILPQQPMSTFWEGFDNSSS
jgi:lysine-specific demethylase 3